MAILAKFVAKKCDLFKLLIDYPCGVPKCAYRPTELNKSQFGNLKAFVYIKITVR